MPDETPEYLLARAVELQRANRRAEAIDVYRQVVVQAPQAEGAWLNLGLLYQETGEEDSSLDAFTSFLEVAGPGNAVMVNFAADQLRAAGRPVPDRPAGEDDDDDDTVALPFERDGESGMMLVRNDAGVEPTVLYATLSTFAGAPTWIDAYLVVRDHPEALSELALTILQLEAEQSEGPSLQNLAVLRRARELGAEQAFAEMVALSAQEFLLLIRGVEEIQPVLQRILSDPQRADAVLDAHPNVVEDRATDILLSYLSESNPPENRSTLDGLRALIERRRVTFPQPRSPVWDYRVRVNAADESRATCDPLIAEGEHLLRAAPDELVAVVDLDLSLVLRRRAETRDDPDDDLDRAAALLSDGVRRQPDGYASVPLRVNLAGTLLRRFEAGGPPQLLEEATDQLRAALAADGGFSSSSALIRSELTATLYRRVELTGDPSLLAESVAQGERAVRATQPRTREWVKRQLNLVNPLLLQAEAGNQDAIDRALRITTELDALLPEDDPDLPTLLLALGRARRQAFAWTQDRAFITGAQDAYRRLLALPGMLARDVALARNNLANSLRHEYDATHDPTLLDAAIEVQREALVALGQRGAETAKQRANLANQFSARYQAAGEASDAEAAIVLYRDVLATPATSRRTRDEVAGNLGTLLFLRARHTHDQKLAIAAMESWDEAFAGPTAAGDPAFALELSRAAGRQLAAVGAFDAAAGVLQIGVAALAAADRQSIDSPVRGRLLAGTGDVLQLAAYALGQAGDAEQAVVVLEEGRARALRDALGLDVAALAALGRVRADLAGAYATAVRDLQGWRAGARGDDDDPAAERVRELRSRLDALAAAIRDVPGFEGFALAAGIETIRTAAADTTLLYGCVTDQGATLFAIGEAIETLQLPELTIEEVDAHASPYLDALAALRDDPDSEPALRAWAQALRTLSGWLGHELMAPACDLLARPGAARCALLLPGRLGLLPVTAAPIGKGRHAIDAVEWTSVPSATALLHAQEVAQASAMRSAALVGDPHPTHAPPLAASAAELHAAAQAFAQSTSLTGEEVRVERVRIALANHDVAHFCCHGLNDPDDPLESYLLLAGDERLTLRDVLALRVWRMRLCVLSACDTGVIGSAVPDEVVSFPAGLVQAGVGGVIAAQWPVWDIAASVFSVKFYALWPAQTTAPASALAAAQRWMRSASRTDVADFIRERIPDASGAPLLAALDGIPPEARPFGSPIDWAAFTYVGA